MIELGQLEASYQEFAKRNIRVIVISNDDQVQAQKSQATFPHLTVISDKDQNIAKSMQVIHPGAAVDGSDTNAPTTFLVDGAGSVRWFFRTSRLVARLSPTELLRAIDETWSKK